MNLVLDSACVVPIECYHFVLHLASVTDICTRRYVQKDLLYLGGIIRPFTDFFQVLASYVTRNMNSDMWHCTYYTDQQACYYTRTTVVTIVLHLNPYLGQPTFLRCTHDLYRNKSYQDLTLFATSICKFF